jgi:hypothetical protein
LSDEIAWVSAILSRWGRWAIKSESGALGFATMSMIASDYQEGDGYDTRIPKGVQDEDMEAVNKAVSKLPHVLLVVVIEVYQRHPGRSVHKNARTLGISRQALDEYLKKAQRLVCDDISLTKSKQGSHNMPNSDSGESFHR